MPAKSTRASVIKGTAASRLSPSAARSRRKFLRIFPRGFADETYVEWERTPKVKAHQTWQDELNEPEFSRLLGRAKYAEIAARAVRIESRTFLLFSFEKMALRDAVRTGAGARMFASGLYDWLYGPGSRQIRFERWVETLDQLPRKQTRVLTWPLATVFGFIAQPKEHIFLKPNVTRAAADVYGFDFEYESRPNWDTYANFLAFAATVRGDTADLRPRDMIDIQSFIWIQGSDEYEE